MIFFSSDFRYGLSGDAHHITSPSLSGDGAIRSMSEALRDSNLMTCHIDYINAHATSTPQVCPYSLPLSHSVIIN
jgi:3-oxoacyl-(acyl-carrier-protein) synthase